MAAWQPASREEVEEVLARGVAALDPIHRARFEAIRVPMRKVAVRSHPGEFVLVVAEHEGKVIYYSDVEDGWAVDALDDGGGIRERGSNQFELSHILHQLFGAPSTP